MTKMVCTVAALQQVERGHLELAAPVDTYCPEFADNGATSCVGCPGFVVSAQMTGRELRVGTRLSRTVGTPFTNGVVCLTGEAAGASGA